jgi:serine/threonine-protein kinase
MQPAIPIGTILQKRYRVTKILGQGGFGRTYLAEDTACFDELCVLKEFVPTDRGKDTLKKSKELFQREAKVLYQIDHPQVPKFHANFEESKRLFLVQEYAKGKTYARLLSDRLKEGKTFTEEECVSFLEKMLPVLDRLHAQGIIHRDISPDNIICREADNLPVLIDFGVVKAGVKNLEAGFEVHEGTTVGKAGYAPNEQLQTGEAYANSDLYALAVTTVVMLTGRKPESLIDKSSMMWKWHQWVPTLSPWFAKILNRMLSPRPNNRYQSAKEVAMALRAVTGLVGNKEGLNLDEDGNLSSPAGSVPLSRTSRQAPVFTPTKIENTKLDLWKNPWVGAGIVAAGLSAILIVPFVVIPAFFSKPSTPNRSPDPNAVTTPAATGIPSTLPNQVAASNPPSPTPNSVPIDLPPETVSLEVDRPVRRQAALDGGKQYNYKVILQSGQILDVKIVQGDALLSILAPDRSPLDYRSTNTAAWQGKIATGGEYTISVSLRPGTERTDFQVEFLSLAPALSSPTPLTNSTSPPIENTPSSFPIVTPSNP